MGQKGDKLTKDSVSTASHLVTQLNELGEVRSKKMFGGHGIFYNDKMFAMVDSKGQCFLKTDEQLLNEFVQIGSVKHSKMPYASIPQTVLDDKKVLLDWSKKSISLLQV